MSSSEIMLEFTRKERLPADTSAYQTDDGTIFYYKYSSPRRLYVKFDGQEIDAELPYDKINCDGAYGDGIYFNSNRKIYKAAFSRLPDRIDVSYQRKQRMDEKIRWRFCSRPRDGEECVYQVCDDPDEDAIVIRGDDYQLRGFELRRLHRGKAIFFSKIDEALLPSVSTITENSIVIEAAEMHPIYASDSSPFLYLAGEECIHTLKTQTMQFLPILRIQGIVISYITGVHDGVITIKGHQEGDCLMTAKLPDEYCQANDQNDEVAGIRLSAMQRLSQGIDLIPENQFDLMLIEYHVKNCELEERVRRFEKMEIEQKKTIETIRVRYYELEVEKDQLRKSSEDEAAELRKTIGELRKSNDVITKERDRDRKGYEKLKMTINSIRKKYSELVQVNDRIHKVNEDEKAKLKATIIELREDVVEFREEKERLLRIHKNEKLELTDMVEILREEIAELTQDEMSTTSEESKDDQFDTIKDLKALIAQLRDQDRTLRLSESEKLNPPTATSSQSSSTHLQSTQDSSMKKQAPPAVSPIPNDPVMATSSSKQAFSPFLTPPSTLPRRLAVSPLASPQGTLKKMPEQPVESVANPVANVSHSPSKKRERSEGLKTVVANLRKRFEQGEFNQEDEDDEENEKDDAEDEEKRSAHHFLRFPSVRL